MKKRILILTLLSMLTINGCDTEEVIAVNVNIDNTETSKPINNNVLGVQALKKIGNGLWYDTTTSIVYWWNGFLTNMGSAVSTPPTPYYSPNGLIYRYIPETNTLEEVRMESKYGD